MQLRPVLVAVATLAISLPVGAQTPVSRSPLARPSKPGELSAPNGKIEVDVTTGELKVKGGAQFTHEGLVVQAESGSRSPKEATTKISGNVRADYEDMRVVTGEAFYDEKTGEFTADAFRLGRPPFYLSGDGVAGKRAEFHTRNVTVYAGEPDYLSPTIHADSAVVEGDKAKLKNATLRLGPVPLFWVPSYSLDSKNTAQHMKVNGGYKSRLGAFLQTETLIPVTPTFSAGPLVDIYSKRGFMVGPSLRVIDGTPDDDHYIISELKGGYIKDSKVPGPDVNGFAINDNRYFGEFQHRQKIRNNWSFTSSLNVWSDSDVLRDFHSDLYDNNAEPDNFLETNYWTDDMVLSGYAGFDPNNFGRVQERVPELGLDLLPNPAPNTDYFHAFSASYARLQQDAFTSINPAFPTNSPELGLNRFDVHYSLWRPFATSFGPITPVLGARLTRYDSQQNGLVSPQSYTRAMGEIGFDWRLPFSHTWDYSNRAWEITDLRHRVTPVVNYRWMPGGKNGNGQIVPMDNELPIAAVPTMDLSDIRYLDQLTDLHQIRFGVENLLETRDKEYGSRELVELNFYQDLRLSGSPNGNEFTSFYTEFRLHPARWVSFDVYNRIDTESLTAKETTAGLTFMDGDVWRLGLYGIAIDGRIAQYVADWNYQITQTWGVLGRWRFDGELNKLTRQTYGLRQRLSQTWGVQYRVFVNDKTSTREGELGFNLNFDFIGF